MQFKKMFFVITATITNQNILNFHTLRTKVKYMFYKNIKVFQNI